MNVFEKPTIIVEQSAYTKLIKDSERLEVLRDYLQGEGYKDIDIIKCILSVKEGEKADEPV